MASILWVTTILLVLQATQSYILLTANMEDVQAIAKQMLSSPVVDQLGRIWRRATIQFNQKLKKPQLRADDDLDSDKEAGSDTNSAYPDDYRRGGRRVLNELSALKKNASGYLKTLRRVFNHFTKE